jgi:hypothetical protein
MVEDPRPKPHNTPFGLILKTRTHLVERSKRQKPRTKQEQEGKEKNTRGVHRPQGTLGSSLLQRLLAKTLGIEIEIEVEFD